MFPAFRDGGPFLGLLPFPTGGGANTPIVTPGTPSVVGTEITFPATSDLSLVGAVYGVEFGIGVGAGYVWSENVAGAASSQTITIDIASYGGTTASVVNAREYYNLDPLDDPSTRVYSAMLAPIVVSASETGTTTEGQTLTGANGIIVGGYQMTLSQSWSACNTAGTSCTPISGATATTLVLTASEVGDTIKYTKTATNTAGSGSATSAASAVVTAAGASLVQNTGVTTATGTRNTGVALTFTFGSSVPVNNFVVVIARSDDPTCTLAIAGGGWTLVESQQQLGGLNTTCAMWFKKASGTISTVDVSASGGFGGPFALTVDACEISGLSTGALDSSTTPFNGFSGSTTVALATDLSPTVSNGAIVAFLVTTKIVTFNPSYVSGLAAGFTYAQSLMNSGAGTFNPTFDIDTIGNAILIGAAFK